MDTNPTRFEKKLYTLERMRKDVEDEIDRSYLQNNVSELITLEDRYKAIILQISNNQVIID